MPTFGPAWVNVYGKPRDYSYADWIGGDEELNVGLGEGCAYRGRLLLALKSRIIDPSSKVGSSKRSTPKISKVKYINRCYKNELLLIT